MKSKAIVLALLACVFGAQAEVVSSQQAAVAAGTWARLGKGAALGAQLGEQVVSTRQIVVTNGCSFYAVRLESGTVFLSGDTDFEPVIAFTSNPDVKLEKGTPLYDLLCGDMRARVGDRNRRRAAVTSANPAAVGASASASRENGLWSDLLGPAKPTSLMAVSSAKPQVSLSQDEIYVDVMLKTEWSQGNVGTLPCYNYYTPNHWVCGCGATAMAQIMRYHAFPTDPIDTETDFEITVGGKSQTVKMEGGTSGVFDWDNMVDKPAKTVMTSEQCEAIGKLTYNAGVAFKMKYTSGESSCLPENAWLAFNTFGYQSGQMFWDGTSYSTGEGGLHVAATRHNVILTSLDAGCPVLLFIYGYDKVKGEIVKDSAHWAGHVVVGDGYGFKKINGVSTEYVHVNLGWAGSDDAWYNVPEIDCSQSGAVAGGSPVDFLYLGGAAYGVSPTVMKEIVSGRVSDEDGVGLTNDVLVTAYDLETGDTLATTTPGPHGVFVFQFDPEVKCGIQAETTAGRKLVASLDDPVSVGRTMADVDTGIVKNGSSVGSRWLGDIVLKAPTVAVIDGTMGEVVAQTRTLDQALALGNSVDAPVTIQILYETELRESVLVDYECTIVATNEDPYASRIVCADGASLTVAKWGGVTLTNVVFGKSAQTPVHVQADGDLRLGGTVDFNVAEGVVAVETEDEYGLRVIAPLTRGFTLSCKDKMKLGDMFGLAEGDGINAETAAAAARLIANADYENGEVRGSIQNWDSDFALVWAEMPVPVEESVGYFVNADGSTNASSRLDFLFDKYVKAVEGLPAGTRLVIRKSGTMNGRYELSKDVRIVGEQDASGDWPTVTTADGAGFVLTGCAFELKNLLFAGHTGAPVVEVNGATGTIASCGFTDILGTAGVSGALKVGAQGAVTLRDCLFADCRTKATQVNGCGGAITVQDAGSRLFLYDTVISNCFASSYGGGVYAGKGTALQIGGRLVVRNNTQGSGEASNVYLAHTNVALHVADKLTGGTGAVGLRIYKGNDAGHVFATVSGDLEALDVLTTAQSFANDANADLEACDVDEAGERFAWRVRVDDRTVDKTLAVAAVTGGGVSGTRYYGTLKDAFDAVAPAGGTLALMKECDFVDSVVLEHDVTITSAEDRSVITRANASTLTVSDGVTLVLSNVVVQGPEEDVQGISEAFFCVAGGTLDLWDGALLANLRGDGSRASGAIAIYAGGSFILNKGAEIRGCGNGWKSVADGTGYGAVSIDAGSADLRGGLITGGRAFVYGGGLFAGNGSTVRVSGETIVLGNTNVVNQACNLTVADKSSLELVGALAGRIGVTRAFSAPTNVFGTVTADLAYAALTNSAANFSNDETGAYGVAVTNKARKATLLVWSSAINEDGSVELDEDGETVTYWCVGDIPPKTPKATPLPIAFSALATPVVPEEYVISVTAAVSKCWYSLYETNSLTGGFKTEGVTPVERKQATEDGTIQFTRPRTGESLFWKVIAEPEE